MSAVLHAPPEVQPGRFGVSPSHVSEIVAGKLWRHVGSDDLHAANVTRCAVAREVCR